MTPVCLITPPSPFLMDQRVFPSLGVLKVAASLERAGVPVEHLDLSGVENYEKVVAEYVRKRKVAFYGVTATTPQMPAAVKISQAIRLFSSCRIVLGGPHVTLVCAACKKHPDGRAIKAFHALRTWFDVLVAGDGEVAVLEVMKPWAPPLIDADNPKTHLFLSGKELEEFPPARHLLDMASYHYLIDGERATSLISQLGCPFACAFCGGRSSPMLRRVRNRPVGTVLQEMRGLYDRYGIKALMFYDDELNVSPLMVKLMDGIACLGAVLGVQWKLRGFIKAELFTNEQAEAMVEAGFRWILVGFESGHPRILDNINKKSKVEDNDRCLQIARRHGLKVKALMSLGHPGESEETVSATAQWLLTRRPDDFDCTVITTYPGTPYYDEAQETSPGVWTYTAKSGDRLHAHEVDFLKEQAFYKGVPGSYKSLVFTDHLSAERLVELRDRLETTVRAKLGIPFNASAPGVVYESSMGMLPSSILRASR